MIKFVTKIFFRNFRRSFKLQLVTMLTFCSSLVLFLIIFHYIHTEQNFNTSFDDYKNIFRISLHVESGSYSEDFAQNLSFIGPLVKETIPEVKEVTRYLVSELPKITIAQTEEVVRVDEMLTADPGFFKVFEFTFVEGTGNINTGHEAFITKSMRETLFGDRQCLGKEIIVDGESHVVGGVFEEKDHSDLSFDVLIIEDESFFDQWDLANTFVRFRNEIGDLPTIERKMRAVVDEQLRGNFNEDVLRLGFTLERLDELHFSEAFYNSFQVRDRSIVEILFWGSFVLLLCASFNYVNLSVAGSMKRIKEISIKKTLGLSDSNLIGQSLTEVTLTIAIALVIASMVILFVYGPLGAYLDLQELTLAGLDSSFFIGLACIIVALIIVSTALKYFFFSKVIKGSMVIRANSASIKNYSVLVVVQLVICLFSIYASYFVKSQLDLIEKREMDPMYSNMLVIKPPDSESHQKLEIFKNEILKHSAVYSASLCDRNSIKGRQSGLELMRFSDFESEDEFIARELIVDIDYFKTMGIDLLTPIEDGAEWRNTFVINSAAASMAHKPVQVGTDRVNGRILLGIADDFAWTAYSGPEPMVYRLNPRQANTVIVRFNEEIQENDLKAMQEAWSLVFKAGNTNYEYMEDIIYSSYSDEFLLGDLATVASVVIYIVSLIGVLSITSLTTLKRLKEYSIRKIFGADTGVIALRLSRELSKNFLIAFVLVVPAVYFILERWLVRFSLKIDISFLQIGLIFVAFALLSMVLNILYVRKLLKSNPAVVLNTE